MLEDDPLGRAGISRFKARKKEAEKKLERVEQNLLRVEDIIEELEKRLRSIKYQAGKARNFQEYDRQLREKRAAFSLAEYHRLTQRQTALHADETALSDNATALRTSIDWADAQASTLDRDLLSLEAELRQLEQQTLTNASEITGNRERIDGSHEPRSRSNEKRFVTVNLCRRSCSANYRRRI